MNIKPELKVGEWVTRKIRGPITKIDGDYCTVNDREYHKKVVKPINPYWENIEKIADAQRAKGINTYRQGLEDNTELDIEATLTYLQEELIDALMYVEHVKAKLRGEK